MMQQWHTLANPMPKEDAVAFLIVMVLDVILLTILWHVTKHKH